MSRPYYRLNEAAEHCGINRNTLRRMVARGTAPAPVIKHGNVRLFSAADIDALRLKLAGGRFDLHLTVGRLRDAGDARAIAARLRLAESLLIDFTEPDDYWRCAVLGNLVDLREIVLATMARAGHKGVSPAGTPDVIEAACDRWAPREPQPLEVELDAPFDQDLQSIDVARDLVLSVSRALPPALQEEPVIHALEQLLARVESRVELTKDQSPRSVTSTARA